MIQFLFLLQGSLPRPPSVLAYLKDRKDEAIPADILETAVKETVQKQIEVLKIVICFSPFV